MTALAACLSGWVMRPVIKRPALEGDYAIKISHAWQRSAPSPGALSPADSDAPVFTAVQEQLGLKLEPATVGVQVIVIDRIERPAEN
jgi:uncharacterized protein (TIGR03435 family)